MKTFVRGAFAAITLGATAVSAFAADLPTRKEAPVVQDDFQRFQVRLLASGVVPLDGTATIYDRGNGSYMNNLTPLLGGLGNAGQIGTLPPATALQALGYSNGAGSVFNGAGTTISWSVIPSLSLGYYLNKNWSVEAICCVSPHHVQGTGSIFGSSVIKTWVFPPSLTLVYHFTNFGGFQPYLGAGVNFTAFWGTRAGNQPFALSSPVGAAANNKGVAGFPAGYTGVVTATGATITPSWGVVGQAGFDYMINQNWGWNFDAKYIMMEPNAHVWANASALPASGSAAYGLVGGAPASVPLNLAVKINPIVISTGLTYRFGGSKEPGIVNTATGGVLAKAGDLLPHN